MNPKVRATTVLIEDGCILLLEQQVTESLGRKWSLPGGTLEVGETLEACVVRETREETGLDVATSFTSHSPSSDWAATCGLVPNQNREPTQSEA
jgi:ADP-ribose pyrophosphatase YjhB (NUDIX family)